MTVGRSRLLALVVSLFASAVLVVAAFNPAPHNGGDNAAYVTLAFSLAHQGTYTDLYDPAGPPAYEVSTLSFQAFSRSCSCSASGRGRH